MGRVRRRSASRAREGATVAPVRMVRMVRPVRLVRPVLAAAVACLLGVAAPTASRGEALTLSYLVGWGHLTLAEAEVSYRQSGSRYRLVGSGRTRGFLALLFSWQGQAETEGVLKAGGRQPLVHEHEATSNRKTRWTRVAWNGGPAPETEARPPADPEKVTPVPEASMAGTRDPFTVLLTVLDALAETGRCEADAKVWDGRRRYDLSIRHLGRQTLSADRPWAYEGVAVGCALEFERIGGFWRESSRWRTTDDAAPDRRVVWAAEMAPGTWVLVRAEVDTRYGTVVGRLRTDPGVKTGGVKTGGVKTGGAENGSAAATN